MEAMDEHGAGAVGSRLFNADGSVQNCGWVLFADAYPQRLQLANAPEVVGAAAPHPADMVSGAAMLLDREALRAVGGWDERFYPAIYVDIDISTSIWNLGKLVLSAPRSHVVHQSESFDRRPSSALTGPRLRTVLLERNSRPFLEKWGSFISERAALPDPGDPDGVKSATAAALRLTRERGEQIRSGSWTPPRPEAQAQRRFSGLTEQPLVDSGDGGFRVAPEVEQALKAAEADLVAEYCLWMVRKEEIEFGRLLDAHKELQWWEDHCRDLEREHDELAERLNQVLHTRTWRLRSSARRLLRRP